MPTINQLVRQPRSPNKKRSKSPALQQCPLIEMTCLLGIRTLFPNNTFVTGLQMSRCYDIAHYALSSFFYEEFSKGTQAISHDYINIRVKVGMLPALALITASVGMGILSAMDLVNIIQYEVLQPDPLCAAYIKNYLLTPSCCD